MEFELFQRINTFMCCWEASQNGGYHISSQCSWMNSVCFRYNWHWVSYIVKSAGRRGILQYTKSVCTAEHQWAIISRVIQNPVTQWHNSFSLKSTHIQIEYPKMVHSKNYSQLIFPLRLYFSNASYLTEKIEPWTAVCIWYFSANQKKLFHTLNFIWIVDGISLLCYIADNRCS